METALIGCGAIGNVLARGIAEKIVDATLEVVYDNNHEKALSLLEFFQIKPKVAKDINEILESEVDLVIEAASIEAVKQYGPRILRSGKNLMAMSVGAFADVSFASEMEKLARENKVKIYLPSGAIGGLDALKSAAAGKIYKVTLRTTKPPKALENAPYLKEKNISLKDLKEKKLVFQGNALQAIRGFPANVNTAVAVSLAGIGAEKTTVEIVADPQSTRNIHEISAEGEFGKLYFKVENLPSPENPRTSLLAAFSAIATLKSITKPMVIGT